MMMTQFLKTRSLHAAIISLASISQIAYAGMDMSKMSMAEMKAMPDMQGMSDMTHMHHHTVSVPKARLKKTQHAPHAYQQQTPLKHAQSKRASHHTQSISGKDDMAGMDMRQMPDTPSMNHSQMPMADMKGMEHSQMAMSDDKSPAQRSALMPGMDHRAMDHNSMDHGNMAGMPMSAGVVRDPDYSQGHGFVVHPPHMMGNGVLSGVVLDRLEMTRTDEGGTSHYGYGVNGEAWLGNDHDRAVLRLDAANTRLEPDTLGVSLAWRRPLNAFWNYDLGAALDHERGRTDQGWLLGRVSGIALYWFKLDGSVLVGATGQIGLYMAGSYDLRLTQKLVLDPEVRLRLYTQDDLSQEQGRGLSEGEFGVRLRYEITRTFAPYVRIGASRYFGRTADLYRAEQGVSREQAVAIGARQWF